MLPLRSCVRFVFVLALLIPATAFAQMRICVYTIEDWVQDVDEIQANLIVPEEETPNFKEAGILIEVMDREWECLVRPVPPEEILRYAQIRAYVSFHSGDPDEALRWNRAAQYMDPSAAFPDWVPEWHPLREQLEWEDPTEITTSEGKHIAHPKKGGVFMNGRFLTAATAPEEVPTLVQVYDKKGARVDIHWQQGSYFKPALVTEEAVVAKAPKWFIPPAPLSGPAVAAADVEEEAVMEEAPPVEEEEPVAEEPEEAPVVVEEEPEEEEPAAEEPAEEAPPEEEVTEEEPAPEPEEAETAEVPPEAVEEEPAEEAVAEAEPAAPAEVTTVAAGAAFAALVGTSDACPEKTTLAALQEATAKGVTAYVDNDKSGLDKAWTAAKESASCLGEQADPGTVAALHRLHAYAQYHGGNADGALQSLRAAAALDPDFVVPVEVAPEAGALSALSTVAHVSTQTYSASFEAPEGTQTWVDGTESTERPADSPSLIQVVTPDGVQWSGWVTTETLPAWMSMGD
ncbi:MAG: hypothetical protein JRI25_02375 [Deltaproteobacteria bacterium]|nr:hypothetical protein [Deltaproteobacteria bacterium]